MRHSIDYYGICIEFDYSPAIAATPARYACGGDPAWPAEVDIISATLEDQEAWDDACIGEVPDNLVRWCEDSEEVREECVAGAEEGRGAA